MIGLQYGVSRRSVPVAAQASEWVRPADWLPLPTVVEGEQKVVALVAVYPHESNHLSLVCSGNYTVDWGDGAVQNFNSGVQADRNYSYASIPANDTSRGYRQVILTITPQSGQTLTEINFNRRHPLASNLVYSHKILDMAVTGAAINTLTPSGTTTNARLLERFWFIGSNLITNFTNFLRDCYSLQSLPLIDTSQGTNFTNFLFNCYSLQSLPLIDTSQGTSFTNFLAYCYSLQSLPLIDTSQGTNFTNFLFSCSSLQLLPLINTSQGTSFTSFLQNCYSLQSLPLIDTSQGTSFTNFLRDCYSLGLVVLQGQKETVSLANLSLGKQALIDLFNSLATVTSKTLTISGNYGAALLSQADRNIAINKGWTLVV